MVKNDYQGSLDGLQKFFNDLDLVITEGYKKENKPKIEVVRAARHADALLKNDKHLVAVVSDVELKLDVPVFDLEDVDRLADFIEEKYLL
jgi:molybdopterin-guanine dinucleotide biosynthesis protein MobB